jgi:hypothetical protein
MTPEEHLLLITMFAKQARQIKVLSEVLKSRGILQGDDLEAFTASVKWDAPSLANLLAETMQEYEATCKAMNVPLKPSS